MLKNVKVVVTYNISVKSSSSSSYVTRRRSSSTMFLKKMNTKEKKPHNIIIILVIIFHLLHIPNKYYSCLLYKNYNIVVTNILIEFTTIHLLIRISLRRPKGTIALLSINADADIWLTHGPGLDQPDLILLPKGFHLTCYLLLRYLNAPDLVDTFQQHGHPEHYGGRGRSFLPLHRKVWGHHILNLKRQQHMSTMAVEKGPFLHFTRKSGFTIS